METVYLDTETTGLVPGEDEILEIAIVNDFGHQLMNTLVCPQNKTSWEDAQRIHGISPEMVTNKPSLIAILPQIHFYVKDKRLVIYNAGFDLRFFSDNLSCAKEHWCAMLTYSNYIKEPAPKGKRGYRWFTLHDAAQACGHVWSGDEHRALSDALACRTVWRWLMRKSRPTLRNLLGLFLK